jgi:transmembrane sensor
MNAEPTFSRIEVEASEWLVAMSDRTVSLEQHARFAAWLNADPERERIYRAQKSAWQAAARMPHLLEATAAPRQSTAVSKWFSLRHAALAASLALVIAGGLFFADRASLLSRQREFATTVGQVKDIRLKDGTLVTLGASSQIEVAFGKKERRVALTRGEAFFEVTRDTTRPFLVTAGDTVVRVVGTKFDVHYGPKAVRVSVLEGRVEVMKAGETALVAPSSPARMQVLTAGEASLTSKSGKIAMANNLNKEDLGAWRQGRLVYVDAHLRDVIADINRYYSGTIELADESVGELQLTTAFRADQIDRMLEVLENALPIKAAHVDANRIVLSSR